MSRALSAAILGLRQVVAPEDHETDDRVGNVQDAVELGDGCGGGVEHEHVVVTVGEAADLECEMALTPRVF